MNIPCKKTLKTILSSTSIVALAFGISTQSSYAVSRTSLNSPSDIGTPGDWNPNGFNSGDSIIFGGDHAITGNNLGNINSYFTIADINRGSIGSIVCPVKLDNSYVKIVGNIITNSVATGLVMGSNSSVANLNASTTPNYSALQFVDFGNTASALLITNNANVTLGTNFLSTGGNNGVIITTGSVGTTTFTGSFSNTKDTMITNINLGVVSKTLFNSEIFIDGKLYLELGAQANFAPNINITGVDISSGSDALTQSILNPFFSISGIIAVPNTLTFEGNNVINSTIGVESPIDEVNISGSNVNFKNVEWWATNTNFTSKDSSVIFTGITGQQISLITNFVNTSGIDATGNIIVNENTDLGGLFGASGAGFNKIDFQADKRFRIMTKDPIFLQNVTTSVNEQGSFVIISDNIDSNRDINFDIGSSTNALNAVIPTGGIRSGSNKTQTTLKTGHSIYAKVFKLYGGIEIDENPLDSSTFILEDGTFLDALVTTTPFIPAQGCGSGSGVKYSEVDILENSTILKDVGTISDLIDDIKTLGLAESKVNLSGSFYGHNITLSGANIILGKDVTFYGNTTADSTIISLGNNTLSYNNPGNVFLINAPIDNSTSVFSKDPVVNFTVDDSKHGNFLIAGGGLDLDKSVDSMNLTLTDLTTIAPPAEGQSYVIFGNIVEDNNQVNAAPTIVIVDDSKVDFVVVDNGVKLWTWSYTNGVVTRKLKPQLVIEEEVTKIITDSGGTPATVNNAIIILNPTNTGSAANLSQNLITLVSSGNNPVPALNALVPVIVEASEQMSEINDQALSTIGNRLRSLGVTGFFTAQNDDDSVAGIAAGDNNYRHGVWSSISYGSVVQKSINSSPGFKSSTTSYTIGGDTLVTDSTTVGMALSYSDNKVNHKGSNNGDTSKVKAYTLSLYTVQELNDKWFIEAVGMFSRNKISNREQRFFSGKTEIAKGDFNSNAYGLNALVGYNNLISQKVLMVTTLGLEYLVLGKSKYKETGTTNENLTIRKDIDHKLDVVAGASFSYDANFNNYRLIPEFHSGLSYDLLNKSPKITASVDGLSNNNFARRTTEAGRVFYNLGTGISTVHGSTEFSMVYDFYMGKKYTAHQGTLKVRVNF